MSANLLLDLQQNLSMELSLRSLPALSVALMVLILRAHGQLGVPCTPAMVNSFTPCMNFLNNATANMSTPTPDCCSSLKSLTANSSGCLCQLLSGSVPFPLPINQTLALSLPGACNMPGVPVQCKASTSSTAPASAPGPVSPAPSLSPAAAASPTSQSTPVPESPQDVPTPGSTTTPATTTPAAASPSSATLLTSGLPSLVLGFIMLFMMHYF